MASEQKFEVTHVEIEERTDEGETQCLVQLSCLPVTVCYGTGKDMASANQVCMRMKPDPISIIMIEKRF